MIHVRRLIASDRQKLEAFVSSCEGATAYHRTAWLAAVERAYGHPGWILTFERGGTILGMLPLCRVAAPLSRGRLVSLPFCDLGGPLAEDGAVLDAMVDAARRLSREENVEYLELRRAGPPLAPGGELGPSRKVSLISELTSSSEEMFSQFKPKLRSQIRKAEKNGVSVELTHDHQAVNAFYPVFARNMRRLGSPVHSRRWFNVLKEEYGDAMLIGLARYQREVVGSAILLLSGSRVTVPWASTASEYNHLAPNMLLYWSLLAWACDHRYRIFDFGRSTVGEGTYRFKRQWGAEPHELRWNRWMADGRIQTGHDSGLSRSRILVERLWQRLPLSIANQLGPRIRKYITL